jgi:hypothetical protein
MGNGPTNQTQQAFTNQSQQQQGRSESQPNSFVQGPLRGIVGDIYKQYQSMPGGSSVPDPSANTSGFWDAASRQAGGGIAGLGGMPASFAANILSGRDLDLSTNPYLQKNIDYAQQPVIKAFNEQVVPGIGSMFEGSGRTPQADNAAGKLVLSATDSLGRNLAGAATDAAYKNFAQGQANQLNVLSQLPGLNNASLANLGLMAQAGQAEDAYKLMKATGPIDWATRAGMGILGLYPGGVTDSNGWSTGSGSTTSYTPSSGGGLGGFLSPILSMLGTSMQYLPMLGGSDRRDKTDITELGVDPLTGMKTYAYRYKGDPKNTPKVIGPMAQDIEKVRPDLVREIGGHKVVAMSALRPNVPHGGLM